MNEIPEVKACADYQKRIIRALDLDGICAGLLSRKVKSANLAFIDIFSWLQRNEALLKQPTVAIIEAYRKGSEYYRSVSPMDQTVLLAIVRRALEIHRTNEDLFFQSMEVTSWVGLADKVKQLGDVSSAAYKAAKRAAEEELKRA